MTPWTSALGRPTASPEGRTSRSLIAPTNAASFVPTALAASRSAAGFAAVRSAHRSFSGAAVPIFAIASDRVGVWVPYAACNAASVAASALRIVESVSWPARRFGLTMPVT